MLFSFICSYKGNYTFLISNYLLAALLSKFYIFCFNISKFLASTTSLPANCDNCLALNYHTSFPLAT
jgi:hypothetical protein